MTPSRRLPPAGLVAALLLAAAAPAQDLLVRAGRVVVAPDTALSPGRFLCRQGQIAYVGDEIPAEAAARATVADFGTAWVVPGFVLAPTTLGQERDLGELALPFTPDLRAAEAFDPWQEELAALPPAGVTAFGLTPSPRSLAGGLGALGRPGPAGGAIAAPEAFATFSLLAAARDPERPPTSLMGAVDLLRSAFAAAKQGTASGPDAAVLRQVLQGGRRAFVFADNHAELTAALDLAKEFGFEPVLVGAREARKVLPRLVAQKAAVVLPVLPPEARLADLQLPTALAQAGVPFAFTGQPGQLRQAAALAVRHGLDRNTALAALTRVPAQLLDQTAAVGALRQGCSADFAVFAGDPLDLDAAHLATYAAGQRLFGDAPGAPRPATAAKAAGAR